MPPSTEVDSPDGRRQLIGGGDAEAGLAAAGLRDQSPKRRWGKS